MYKVCQNNSFEVDAFVLDLREKVQLLVPRQSPNYAD